MSIWKTAHPLVNRTSMNKSINPLIKCACGCGQLFKKYSPDGKPRRFSSSGHSQRGIKKTLAWRRRMSRLKRKDRGPNPWLDCRCGCGKRLRNRDSRGRVREFIPGHHRRGKTSSDAHRLAIAREMTGMKNHRWNPNRKEVGRQGQDFTKSQRKRLLAKHCRKCGAGESLALDHIVPIMAGGTNSDANAQTLCRKCNGKKRDTDILKYSQMVPVPQKIPHPNWMGNHTAGSDGYIHWGDSKDGSLFRKPGTRFLAVKVACTSCRKKLLIAAWRMKAYASRPKPKNHFCDDICRLEFLNKR